MRYKKKLAIGISDYEKIIENNYFYFDKTLFIKEIIDNAAEVILLPHPRRFGKTLNLSMLRYFFEKSDKDHSHLFKDFQIWQQGEYYKEKQGKYPVIYLTFKDVKSRDWQKCYEEIKSIISYNYNLFSYLLDNGILTEIEREHFKEIMLETASEVVYKSALKNLTEYLSRCHRQKVIVLIDEYDTPIHTGYFEGYYKEVIHFMKGFLGAGLKDNVNLEKGVITGILRVAKESIFSGLKNLGVYSLLQPEFKDSFGFSIEELKELLDYYDLSDKYAELNRWYNGYIFGNKVVFNPWPIIHYIESKDKLFRPYWSNTSSNELIQKLIIGRGDELKRDLETFKRWHNYQTHY